MQFLEKQRGLSLIELMIGILLSAVLLLGVLQIFDANRRTHSLQESLSRIQESGRMATDMLSKELRGAAFDGCVVDPTLLVNNADTIFDGDFVSGTDNVTGTVTLGGKTVEPGTDVLRVRGALDACGGEGRIAANISGTQVEIEGSCNGIKAGDYVMVASCRAGDITTVASLVGSPTILTVDDTFSSLYDADAAIYRPYVRDYFISRDTTTNLPGLFVRENEASSAQELIPGVEDLQVIYGRDAGGGDDIVDIWGAPPANAVESGQVAAIRIQLLVAADERSGAKQLKYTRLGTTVQISAPDDGRLRKTYSALTKLRNRGSR
ncbi:PilW family protein [Microbulbifer hainanensis]|uniref:PilW family protein n=1 Tax=Microbulbifer hainanensis TaxID=2735675 RepID=UPI0018690DDE|nr:PilW family protein [Microbulbifer hainanensis]